MMSKESAGAMSFNQSTFAQYFEQDGFAALAAILSDAACADISSALTQIAGKAIGYRSLLEFPWCKELAQIVRAHPAIAATLVADAVAVQCTYFEKSQDRNWLVPIHQDLSIPVREKIDHPALSGWSEKEGVVFVQPPEIVLGQLTAVRLHIDDCGMDDGPLRVVPGSHLAGKFSAEDALIARDTAGEVVCTVEKGGALLLRPLLLHASSKTVGASRRRVLHMVFGPRVLPFGLEWQHAV